MITNRQDCKPGCRVQRYSRGVWRVEWPNGEHGQVVIWQDGGFSGLNYGRPAAVQHIGPHSTFLAAAIAIRDQP